MAGDPRRGKCDPKNDGRAIDMPVEVFIPKMTDHMETGRIIRWLVKEGDRVEQRQVIMEIETDKAVAELESPASGILRGMRGGAVEGALIPVGETIAFITQPDEQAPALPPLATLSTETSLKVTGTIPTTTAAQDQLVTRAVRASPAVRRIARELGIELSLIAGTGPDGKIVEEDVRAFAARGDAHTRSMEATIEPPKWVNLTTAQRLTGERMVQSIQTAPQFALTVSVDMDNALQFRDAMIDPIEKEAGERLSITAVLVKTVAAALKTHPGVNASFEEGRVRLHKQVNVGVAVGAHAGLIVPVIKEADQKSLVQIVRELRVFREKARVARFSADDLTGGTFTISNLGMYGIDQFNAIINPPESAILAVGRIISLPVGTSDRKIVLRPVMHLTLTVDHRVMDGIQAAKFLAEIKRIFEDSDTLKGLRNRQGTGS